MTARWLAVCFLPAPVASGPSPVLVLLCPESSYPLPRLWLPTWRGRGGSVDSGQLQGRRGQPQVSRGLSSQGRQSPGRRWGLRNDVSHQGAQPPRAPRKDADSFTRNNHQTAAAPFSEQWEFKMWKAAGCWPQRAEMRTEGVISGSPDSCIFPYREKHWIPWDPRF